jgi:DNA-binding transcriptional MerR regulator
MTTKHETFSIGDTARMTGVSQKQLRYREAREFISAPMRIVCGQRA